MPKTSSPDASSPRSRSAATANKKKDKKGLISEHGGTIVLLAIFFLFGGYMLDLVGIKSFLDHLFGGMNESAHSHDQAVASTFLTVFPFVILAMGVALVMILFGGRSGGKKRKKTSTEDVSGELSLHAFAELARTQEISPKVARAAYRAFQPDFEDRMRTLLEANLRTELKFNEESLEVLVRELERRTDRNDVRTSACTTVRDLLLAVESRPDELVRNELRAQAQSAVSVPEKGRVITPLPRRSEIPVGRVPVVHAPILIQEAVATPLVLAGESSASKPASLFVRPTRIPSAQPLAPLQASH